MTVIRNQWYPILESRNLARAPQHVRRLGHDLVVWRRVDGRAVVQADRCPHKGVRLSNGRLHGDHIQCPYHGFRFDASGACVAAPCIGSGGHIPASLTVPTFITREAHHFLWLWHGDAAAVRPDLPLVPELTVSSPVHGFMSYDRPVHYTRYIESLLEFYHVPWVHRGRWYNTLDHFAVGGLRPGARKRYFGTTKVINGRCTVEDQRIDYTFELVNENDPTVPAYPWRIVFVAPCLVYVENNEFTAAQWSTPIDEQNTHILFKWLGFKHLSVPVAVQKVLTRLTLLNQRYGQDFQDFEMMRTQSPRVSDVGVNKFVAADELNAQYLHLRRRLRREAGDPKIVHITDPSQRDSA